MNRVNFSRWSASQTEALRRLFDAGYSSNQIAKLTGLTPATVRSKCRHMGWWLADVPRGKRRVCGTGLFRRAA